MVSTQNLQQVLEKKQRILQGEAERVNAQRQAGKMTARERIDALLDSGSFVETDALVSENDDYAGVVTGYGTIDGRPVYLFAQDFTVHGGAMGRLHAKKVCKVLDLAVKTGAPVIALCDSAGVRVDEGAAAMNAYAAIYSRMARMSGVCPMVSLILGPAIGGAALVSQLCDVSIEAQDVGSLMVYGPQVMSAMNGKTFDLKTGGGADVMQAQGGIALKAVNETDALALCKKVLDLLPSSCDDTSELVDTDDLNRLLAGAEDADAASLMAMTADAGSLVEFRQGWGMEIRTALCRIGGHACGLIVSDPDLNDGMLTAAGCRKAAALVQLCDCFDLPVVNLVDSRGLAVPAADAQADTLKAAAELLYACAGATCSKICVITGNAIGQSYVALGGKENADMTYAWPGAVISALTPEAAVQVLYADELKKGRNRTELQAEFAYSVADGLSAAAQGMIDDIIEPAETRKYIIAALEMLWSKQEPGLPRKHGNMPV